MRNMTMMQRLTYGFGISMAVLMVLTLFLPGLAPDTPIEQEIPPTEPPPVPTLPPPLTDFSGIAFAEDALEDSGLFAVGVPTGWEVNNAGPPAGAVVNLNNGEQLSVIQVQVEQGPPVTTTEELSAAYFTPQRLNTSWQGYTNPQELTRDIGEDRLLIEFALENPQGQEFFARHASWTDGTWVYTARVVVPQNAVELLDYLLDPVIDSITPQTQFQNTPINWTAYYDALNNVILRHPAQWRVTDGGADGVPTSFSLADGTLMRVETQETTIADEDAARAWVEATRAGVTAETVAEVERNGASGYSVSYSFTTPDGEPLSGYALLLNNNESDLLHAANILLPVGGVDLNSEEDQPAYNDIINALGTFSLITGLDLPEPEMPVEEVEAVEEATEEAEEATEEPAAEATEAAASDEGDTEGDDAEATEEATEDDDSAENDAAEGDNAEATEEAASDEG